MSDEIKAFFERERPEITLQSTFIVHKSGDALKIVFYLTH